MSIIEHDNQTLSTLVSAVLGSGLVHGVDWLATIVHGALPAHGIGLDDSASLLGKPLDGTART